MARLRVLAFAAAIVSTPAAAEPSVQSPPNAISSVSRIVGEPPAQIERRGIIAGKQVAPGTVLGLGIFQTAPKMRGYVGDVPHNVAPRGKTRRAAVGLSLKF